jgi:YHS domain-containing protein
METLFFSFLFWAGITFLMMRRGRSSHLMGQKRLRLRNPIGPNKCDGLELRWVPPAKDIDPACGKTVTTDKAKPSVYAGNVYYFCSRECREVFEAAPAFYVRSDDAEQRNLEHSHALS